MNKPTIAITMGDAAGIGPELVVKALSDPSVYERCQPLIIGDVQVMANNAAILESSMTFRQIGDFSEAQFAPGSVDVLNPPGFQLEPVPLGAISRIAGKASGLYLQTAFELVQAGKAQGVVSAPMNKEAFRLAGYEYFDELEFLTDFTNSEEAFLLGSIGSVWAATVTEHIAFKDILDFIKTDRILRHTQRLQAILKRMEIESPRIAVAALNPHAGEGGLFGSEEIDEIAPAVEQAVALGIQAEGPVPADICLQAGVSW